MFCLLYPTMVTTAHQKASGMDLKKDISVPASAKYTADENRTTPSEWIDGEKSCEIKREALMTVDLFKNSFQHELLRNLNSFSVINNKTDDWCRDISPVVYTHRQMDIYFKFDLYAS